MADLKKSGHEPSDIDNQRLKPPFVGKQFGKVDVQLYRHLVVGSFCGWRALASKLFGGPPTAFPGEGVERMPKKTAEELAETNLRGYAETRLGNLEIVKLRKLGELFEIPDFETIDKEALVKELLARKKSKSPKPKEEDAKKETKEGDADDEEEFELVLNSDRPVPDGITTKLIPSGQDGIALEVTVESTPTSTRVLKERHSLHIICFNSLKLRVGKAALADEWAALFAVMATADVILIQEVPFQKNLADSNKRGAVVEKALEMHSGDLWSRHASAPSGPGNEEVHECFVRHPIRVVDTRTTMTSSSGGSFSHAPFSLLLEDKRFEDENDQRFVVTSVHFPPKGKKAERDNQIKNFFEDYSSLSINRLLTPLTAKGAKDAGVSTVNHIVCGDFNVVVTDDIVTLEKNHFGKPLLDARIATSAGGAAYDNFLLSNDAVFAVEARPLELAVCSQRGLSDHHPIALKLTEVSKVKKK
ncbi:hypothetical protein N9S30_00330 [bacterium]|nr:hypothetical protein [bacterium]